MKHILIAISIVYLFPALGMYRQKPRIPHLQLPKKEYLEEYRQEIIHLDLPFIKWSHAAYRSPYYSDRYGNWGAGWPNGSMNEKDCVVQARMLAMIESRVRNKQDLHIPITIVDEVPNIPARTIMSCAVQDDKFIAVTQKLLTEGVNPNEICEARCNTGWCPLQLALVMGAKKTVELLVRQPGIDVHIKDTINQQSLLYFARIGFKSIQDQYFVIKLLLAAGLNPNSVDAVGQTELFNFAMENDTEVQSIILLMCEYGLNINIKDDEGKTALDRVKYWRDYYLNRDQESGQPPAQRYVAADIISQVPQIQAQIIKENDSTYLSLLPSVLLVPIFNWYHQ